MIEIINARIRNGVRPFCQMDNVQKIKCMRCVSQDGTAATHCSTPCILKLLSKMQLSERHIHSPLEGIHRTCLHDDGREKSKTLKIIKINSREQYTFAAYLNASFATPIQWPDVRYKCWNVQRFQPLDRFRIKIKSWSGEEELKTHVVEPHTLFLFLYFFYRPFALFWCLSHLKVTTICVCACGLGMKRCTKDTW